jgi:hypothetical protein
MSYGDSEWMFEQFIEYSVWEGALENYKYGTSLLELSLLLRLAYCNALIKVKCPYYIKSDIQGLLGFGLSLEFNLHGTTEEQMSMRCIPEYNSVFEWYRTVEFKLL